MNFVSCSAHKIHSNLAWKISKMANIPALIGFFENYGIIDIILVDGLECGKASDCPSFQICFG